MNRANLEPIQAKTSCHALHYCFLGAGSMAEAIVRGMLEQRITTPDHIAVTNRNRTNRLHELQSQYGVTIDLTPAAQRNRLVSADVIVLAVKPKDAIAVLHHLQPLLRADTLFVSVVTGLTIQTMQDIIGLTPIVRTMPNTSSSIGLGATAFCSSPEVTATQTEIALSIFQAMGTVTEVEEFALNMVTGLSGSGPAYIYYVMEAMIQAGIEGGLSSTQARDLTVQTVIGAGEMVKRTGESPATLRRNVTSPGGTTQEALNVLEQYQLAEAIKTAVQRAKEKAGDIEAQLSGNHPR